MIPNSSLTKMEKDIISDLPDALISHVLSFLAIKDSALTSVLSKKWRYLFAFTPNLKFDDSVTIYEESNEKNRIFMDFVDRVLGLQGNSTLKTFSLQCQDGVNQDCVTRWITNVMERGVSDLDLSVTVNWHDDTIPASVFLSNSLVRLRVETGNGVIIHVGDAFLPKLKTLYLDLVLLTNGGSGNSNALTKLISSCPLLEELVMINLSWHGYWRRFVSSKTLKRLTLYCQEIDSNPFVVTFDTPNLVYLEYSDHIAQEYKNVNLDSLVEASIGLQMTSVQLAHATYGDMVGDATDLIMGISNVRILYLFGNTLEVITFCCEQIPMFKNLNHLTINTHSEVGWESLPALLKNCPNLETLVFQGLHHKYTIKCGDVDGCLCKFSGVIPSCLSSSPVKALKVVRFGETGVENEIELIKHFLETMPRLEQVTICYDTSIDDDDLIKVSSQLSNFPRASPNCEIQFSTYWEVDDSSPTVLISGARGRNSSSFKIEKAGGEAGANTYKLTTDTGTIGIMPPPILIGGAPSLVITNGTAKTLLFKIRKVGYITTATLQLLGLTVEV